MGTLSSPVRWEIWVTSTVFQLGSVDIKDAKATRFPMLSRVFRWQSTKAITSGPCPRRWLRTIGNLEPMSLATAMNLSNWGIYVSSAKPFQVLLSSDSAKAMLTAVHSSRPRWFEVVVVGWL